PIRFDSYIPNAVELSRTVMLGRSLTAFSSVEATAEDLSPEYAPSPVATSMLKVSPEYRRCPPRAGWSSTSTTLAPALVASSAAKMPQGPPPITATSAWRLRCSKLLERID